MEAGCPHPAVATADREDLKGVAIKVGVGLRTDARVADVDLPSPSILPKNLCCARAKGYGTT
jgi:hypothetical protein